jgi:hypothetical protein
MTGPNGKPITVRVTPGAIEITAVPGTPDDQITRAIAHGYEQSYHQAVGAVRQALAGETRAAR